MGGLMQPNMHDVTAEVWLRCEISVTYCHRQLPVVVCLPVARTAVINVARLPVVVPPTNSRLSSDCIGGFGTMAAKVLALDERPLRQGKSPSNTLQEEAQGWHPG